MILSNSRNNVMENGLESLHCKNIDNQLALLDFFSDT